MSKRITVPEIAEQLGLGRDAVYELLQRGEIPNIRLTNRYIVTRVAFERWLETCGSREKLVLQ